MNEYIVSPMIFYLMDCVCDLEEAAIILAVIGIVFIAVLMAITIAALMNEDEDIMAMATKFLKPMLWVTGIAVLMAMLIPGEETIVAMWIAKYATFENADLAINSIKEAVDYLISSMKELE
ncbi:MAG: hypothetical protein IJB67_05355 [Firmicutes bacterium]|nr:hypothetical protein [Bacillota bacterium]